MVSENKPWGRWEEYVNDHGYRVKRLFVDPGKRFSLQKHKMRSEVWIVANGSGLATVGNTERHVGIGEVIIIPEGEVHRLTNDQHVPLVIIEVQLGVCDENDIERLSDDWDRT